MARFNTYIEHPEIERWRDLCVNDGELCQYNKGDEFVSIGRVARYIGYVKSGTLKYVVYDELGKEHVCGFSSEGEFVADWPFALHGEKRNWQSSLIQQAIFTVSRSRRLWSA